MPNPQLIVAVDTSHVDVARCWIDRLRGNPRVMFKFGMEFTAWHSLQEILRFRLPGEKVFIDGKAHDIADTVEETVKAIGRIIGPRLLTVHATGGPVMMEAAVRAAREASPETRIIAVTVPTGMGDTEFSRTFSGLDLHGQVLHLAGLAYESGCHGVVCAAREAADVKRHCGKGFLVVTPGLRAAESPPDGQARRATPGEAAEAGADYLVAGRMVTAAPDPAQAVGAILADI